MKKADIRYEVTELAQMSTTLREANEDEEVSSYLMHIYYNMCDLTFEPDYANSAEEIIQCIDTYMDNDVSKAKREVLSKLEALIEKMQEDMQKLEETSQMQAVCEEIRATCSNVASIISREAKTAWKDVGETIKAQEMPECTEAIAEVKKIPKRFKRNLKKGIKKWLKEDE